ncbi:MAG: helix-turn-helix transcriptional regulator [Opitutales bacterium]|nr:helix-turn-helix transcriptional regulator [Opitutales bacterium]
MDLHRLPPDKTAQLLESILRLNAIRSLAVFREQALRIVDELISAEASSLRWTAAAGGKTDWIEGHRFPYSKDESKAFRSQLASHPILEHYSSEGSGEPVRLTDLMSALDWRRHTIYRSSQQNHRLAFTLALCIEGENSSELLLLLDRSLFDFGDEELALLNALGPHLLQLLERLSSQGTVPGTSKQSAPAQTPKALAQALGVTLREAEILQQVAEGLSDKAIAERFKLHFTTVKKHLRNAYAKLDIPGRQAAILLVLEKTGKLR